MNTWADLTRVSGLEWGLPGQSRAALSLSAEVKAVMINKMPQNDEQIARGLAYMQKPKKSNQHLCTVWFHQQYTKCLSKLVQLMAHRHIGEAVFDLQQPIRSWCPLSIHGGMNGRLNFLLGLHVDCWNWKANARLSHTVGAYIAEVSDWGAPGASRVITQTRAPTQKFREASFRKQCGEHKGSFACREPPPTYSAEGCKIVAIVALDGRAAVNAKPGDHNSPILPAVLGWSLLTNVTYRLHQLCIK